MVKFKRCVTAGEMLVGPLSDCRGSVEGESTRFIERRPSIDGMPSVCVCVIRYLSCYMQREGPWQPGRAAK